MKTNKKLKLNTKKVVILSNEQQDSVQGGTKTDVSKLGCGNETAVTCIQTRDCPSFVCPTVLCYSQVPPPPPYSCV